MHVIHSNEWRMRGLLALRTQCLYMACALHAHCVRCWNELWGNGHSLFPW